jgi:hypothetical protein
MDRSDEKEFVNADEYAAMRKELVTMWKALNWVCDHGCDCSLCVHGMAALDTCPIAAELSKQEGGNG